MKPTLQVLAIILAAYALAALTGPAVYETVSSASDNADSPANSFQNWNESNSPSGASSPDEKWAREVAAVPASNSEGPWGLDALRAVAP